MNCEVAKLSPCIVEIKGALARESQMGSQLVSLAIGHEKNFGCPTILVKKKNLKCKISTVKCENIM